MSLDLLVLTPEAFDPTQPLENNMKDVLEDLKANWQKVGSHAGTSLWCVSSALVQLAEVHNDISIFHLPLTIIAVQNAVRTPKVTATGIPVLGEKGVPLTELVVELTTTESELLPYMPAELKIDTKTGKVLGEKPATKVVLPILGGHEAWLGNSVL